MREMSWGYAVGKRNKMPGVLENELRLGIEHRECFNIRTSTCLEQCYRQAGGMNRETWADCVEIAKLRRYSKLELARRSLNFVEAMPVVGVDSSSADENGSRVEQDQLKNRAPNFKR